MLLGSIRGALTDLRDGEDLVVGGRVVRLRMVRNLRARRYVLRVTRDGAVRATIPRGGSVAEARRFVDRQRGWIERQLEREAARPARAREWHAGTGILLRGETVNIGLTGDAGAARARVGDLTVPVADPQGDLRPEIERHLRRLAGTELPPRLLELAAVHQFPVRRVTVRAQKSRWGSCSARGTISVNWRLIHAPLHVRDYIFLHELCHLRQMNHSSRFWAEVERVCPGYETAERWLKQHGFLLE